MINSPGQTCTREEIGKLINLYKERSIDVIITRLRKKIEDDPKNPKFILTVPRKGYRMVADFKATELVTLAETNKICL